jgi:hypothetical protein
VIAAGADASVRAPPNKPWYVAVQVTVSGPGVDGVAQATDPRMTLHVEVEVLHVWLTAPVSVAGVTVPPLTPTSTLSTFVGEPMLGLPSAKHSTWIVDPAGTSPGGAWILAVTVIPARAVAGNAASSASDAYT